MIFEFSIANTFSISEKQTLSFEAVLNDNTDDSHCIEIGGKKVLKMMCLYGANASGKTKLLEAFDFFLGFMLNSFTRLEPNERTQCVPFKFSKKFQDLPGEFELIFYVRDIDSDKYIRYEYIVQLTKDEVVFESLHYAPKKQKKLIFERKKDSSIKWGSDILGTKKIIEEMTRPNCSLISAGAQAQNPIIKHFYDSISTTYHGLLASLTDDISNYVLKKIKTDSDFKNKVHQLLSSIDIGNIKDIDIAVQPFPDLFLKSLPAKLQEEIKKNNKMLKKVGFIHNYDNENYFLPLSKESGGTLKMMEMAAPLHDLTATSSIVLIDELETSLHQELLETFLQIFLKSTAYSQLIFTTHNQDLLDSGLLRDDEVWFCYKTENGNSKYNSITHYTGIRKSASRKKLYKADIFGALPNININVLQELFCAEENGAAQKK